MKQVKKSIEEKGEDAAGHDEVKIIIEKMNSRLNKWKVELW